MITKENYSEDHIRQLRGSRSRDPILIERTLFAFGLLEALAQVGMDFTFKGGSSLMLLLSKPMRLSTDIDIVVKPGTDVDEYIRKASIIFPFRSGGEQARKKRGRIEKRHFKFYYDSPMHGGEPFYILLDILFEENHYEQIIRKEIANDLLLTQGSNLSVMVPSVDCVLGDKLTAFAPYTTGIPLRQEKDLEVMKQFFDVCSLIDEFTDFDCVSRTYFTISETEIGYREKDIKPADALQDTIQAALCIGSRGKVNEGDFPSYLKGSRDIVQHIYAPGFSMEQAAQIAPKVLYMAACLLTGTRFERASDPKEYGKEKLEQPDIQLLRVIRRANPTGYEYLVKADRLLSEYRK
ncbi:MAG: nucleotidyl transferase AbiEii/AbiGii toxin family protein [Oscillospiraceae bacterium]|nr:nucleotidyl transferase AbiEii/AbiGii toxin family protein [Oscillospiraceae bacterium]